MENAEERKKMKKIEKEEQLKKKLEQTMEEKMAADSKTVEGESAVVKAEEGNTATEQEPEAAPALSEEELNAMYERFQQRLQKEGLADAEGNPTEKTLEIRRQIVEKKVEREKQAERQKKIAKRAKTTKHWVRTAKAAGVVLVVGACVFGASMTSEANRIRLVETVHGVWNTGDATGTDNGFYDRCEISADFRSRYSACCDCYVACHNKDYPILQVDTEKAGQDLAHHP